jgi:hypothetical protein
VTLPRFPVDDQTLGLLHDAITSGRGSLINLCVLYSQMAGSDTDAVQDEPLWDDERGIIRPVMRDPQYHPDDVMLVLIEEIRRLRMGQ